MGLLTIIKKQKQKDKEIRCLVIGLDNSGKSTIVNKLLPKEERDSKITPTIGFQIKTFQINETFNINLWDIGGQNTLRPFWENYFNKTDVLMWCIDISLPVRFDESFNELTNLVMRNEDRIGYDCHVIIIFNKIDLLEGDRNIQDDFIKELRENIINSFGNGNSTTIENDFTTKQKIDFVECSAITGDGLESIKQCIISEISR